MIARRSACCLLLLAIGCSTRAAIPPPRTPLAATPASALALPPAEGRADAPFSMHLASHQLDNGMRLLVSARDQSEGLASVVFVARAGALYDARTSPAVTHALSRLLLRATRDGDAVVEDLLEARGFHPSAASSEDGLLVHAIIDATELPRYLDALDLALRHPALRPQDLERVRADDGELLDARLATPYGLLDDRLASMLYVQSDPRAYSLGRWLDDLRAMSIDSVAERHRQILDPAQCALVIAGDVDPLEVLPLADRAFGAWPSNPSVPSVQPPGYRGDGARGLGIVRPLMRSYVRLVDTAPPLGHPDHAAFLVIEQLLGGMFTARLNLAIRERFAASYGVHARYRAAATGGQMEIETAIEPAHAGGVVQAIVSELRRVRGQGDGGVTERELAIARTRARELMLAQLDTTLGLASVLAQWTLAGQEPGALSEALRAIDRIDADALEAAARRWLRPDRAPIAVVGAYGVLDGPLRAAGVGEWEIIAAPERRRR